MGDFLAQQAERLQEKKNRMAKVIKRSIIGGVTFVALLGGWFTFTETIQQGHVGVVYSRSTGVEDTVLPQGLHFVNPIKRITQYPVSTETVTYKELSLATKDGKPLTVDITYDYFNETDKTPYIYNKFKGQKPDVIEENWLKARLRDSALEVTSKYTILEVFQNREKISKELEKIFSDMVEEHGFVIENVVFGTPKPDEETQKAIQSVVNKQQELEALKIEQEKASVEAETKRIEAEGKAQAKIEEAKGEAEANRIVSESITGEILQKMELEARQKHGWVTVNGGNAIVDQR